MKAAPKYYLSEMNVSAKHGGGLTLMRILGDELDDFDFFISPTEYPVRGFDSIAKVQEKELNLWEQPGDFVPRPFPRRFTKAYFANQIKRALGTPNPKYINWDYYRKFYTEYLIDNLDLREGTFLIVPQNAHSVILANHLFKRAGIRYVTWIMDDNLLHYDAESRSLVYPYPRNYEAELQFHLQNAKHVFVISDNMGRFYKNRYGIDYTVLFSPSDPEESVILKKDPADTIRFCHFGRIWKWPLDAVEAFATKLEEINGTLDIFSYFTLEGSLKENSRVRIKEPVDSSRVRDTMAEYDAVTIFYGFNDEVRPWSELNISTKMSECLASGLPVVFVGPEWAAMTDWIRKHDCGMLITDPENPAQIQKLSLLRDHSFRYTCAKNCVEVSAKHTSVRAMRQVWREGWSKV